MLNELGILTKLPNPPNQTPLEDTMEKKTCKLGEYEIELADTLPRFALMGMAAAHAGGSPTKINEAMWRLTRALVKDWDLFERAMLEDDSLFDKLDDFVNEAVESYDDVDPTEESSDSASSSTSTETTSRVVSLERGTVEVREPEMES